MRIIALTLACLACGEHGIRANLTRYDSDSSKVSSDRRASRHLQQLGMLLFHLGTGAFRYTRIAGGRDEYRNPAARWVGVQRPNRQFDASMNLTPNAVDGNDAPQEVRSRSFLEDLWARYVLTRPDMNFEGLVNSTKFRTAQQWSWETRTPGTMRTIVITSSLLMLAAIPAIITNPEVFPRLVELATLSRAGFELNPGEVKEILY